MTPAALPRHEFNDFGAFHMTDTVAWARQQRRLPLAARAVLILAAERAAPGAVCHTNPARLGQGLDMTAEAVRVHLKALVDRNLVEVEDVPKRMLGQPDLIRIRLLVDAAQA